MKKFRFPILTVILICCAFALAACGEGDLITPRGLRVNGDTLELGWYAVPDARYYTVEINGAQRDTRKNTYSLTNLDAGNYTIRVKAFGADDAESKWSDSINFVREREPGFGFALINGKREYEVTGLGSLEGNVTVPDTYRGKPVTRIGRRAFANRTKLTGITLPESIIEIGEQAFYNCSYLENLNIPSSVVSIGSQAFQSCRLLAGELVIPDAVTEIGDGAFAYCQELADVKIGGGVKTIGDNAFANCEKLERIVIPDGVESIGEYSFSKCVNATVLSMGKKLETIGGRAFYGCEKLTAVAIGDAVKTVGEYAFSDCAAVESVRIPDSAESIGDGAFTGCVKLGDISLGRNVTSIGVNAFYNTAIWKPMPENAEEGDEESAAIIEYNKNNPLVYVGTGDRKWLVGVRDKSLADYDILIDQDIYAIGGGAFYEHAKLDTVKIPDSVQLIDGYTFYGCGELVSVTAGRGVKTIGERAFASCPKLSLLTLGTKVSSGLPGSTTRLDSSLEKIGNYAFNGCTVLGGNGIGMPDSLREVGTGAFNSTALWNRTDETSAVVYADTWAVGVKKPSASQLTPTVKDGTKGIANYAFYGATIFGVTVADSVEYIGRGAFSQCGVLQYVNLPRNLEKIEDYTFYRCPYLSSCELPLALRSIGRSAFYGCKNFGNGSAEFTIPASVESIGDYAFYGCGDAVEPPEGEEGETVYIGPSKLTVRGGGNTVIGEYAFANFVSVREVDIGNGVKEMGQRAFYKCVGLRQVTIGSGLTEIPDRAFYGCTSLGADIVVNGVPYMNRVRIPDNIKRIGNYAFYRNESLKYFVMGEGVTEIGDYAFYGCIGLGRTNSPQFPAGRFDLKNVTKIGRQAFRNCTSLTNMVLGDNVTELGMHAFYGCTSLSLYIEHETQPEGWAERWNSSYRPAVWNAELGDDGTYVASITVHAGSIANNNEKTALYDPSRAGYDFLGWSLSPSGDNADDFVADVTRLPDGTVVYAVWEEAE